MDGLFGDYVLSAYKEYFAHQGRFVFQDLSKADSILGKSKIPLTKLLDDPKVLVQIARSTRTQTILRTKIRKEGPQYRILIDWLHAPKMELLASETFVLQEGNELEHVGTELKKGLSRLIAKVPWKGNVTGRDGDSITVNIGADQQLNPGDELVIGTLDEAKHHPLLNAVVDWRLSRTGKAAVETVEDGIAFAKVLEEDPGRQILRNQKIAEVLPARQRPAGQPRRRTDVIESATLDPYATPASVQPEEGLDKETQEDDFLDQKPKLGYASLGLMFGKFSRDFTNGATNTGKTGSSGLFGAKLDGQLWLTGDVYAEMGLGFGSGTYTQENTGTPAAGAPTSPSPSTGVNSSLSQFRFDLGYNFLGAPGGQTSRASVRGGYKSDSYSLPESTTELTSPLSFKSFFIGVNGELPLRSGFGLDLGLDFGLLNSVSDSTGSAAATNGSSNVAVTVGAHYRYKPRLTFRLTAEILAQSVDFADRQSISHKVFAVIPAALFYF